MSWCVSPGVYPEWTPSASWNWLTIFFSMLEKFSTIISSKNFSYPFFFFFFFCNPYNSNVGEFEIVPEVTETILRSFRSFYFILLFRSYSHLFIFQLTDLSLCFRHSAIDSFQSIFTFSNCVVCLCLFFNSSWFLLIDFCIFSILSSRFLIIFIITTLNSFLVFCLFLLHLFGLLHF